MHTMFRTLIPPEALHAHLDEPAWRVIDCRFDLARPDAGEAAWREAHIPGAVYAHLDLDLSSAVGPGTGRHPLPDADQLAARLGEWGICADTQVVAYDASGGAMAARLWWLLRWLGHEAVAVLDGSWQGWQARGYPTDNATPNVQPAAFLRRASLGRPVQTDEVMAAVNGASDMRLVDARGVERFRGDVEPIDSVAGHIPGALNRPFNDNLGSDGFFLAPEILRERFGLVSSGHSERVAHYCGSGVTACHNVLAMELAELSGSRLYAGSWSEWIRDSSRPVKKGD